MNITEALAQLRNEGTTTLKVYWLEENEEGNEYWWCDVMNDDLFGLCEMNWIWTVMSRAEYENEEPGDSTNSDEDWFIIVDEEKFSHDLICDHIKWWLRDRGFDFKVNEIDPENIIGMNRVLETVGEIKDAEDAIEASATETGL